MALDWPSRKVRRYAVTLLGVNLDVCDVGSIEVGDFFISFILEIGVMIFIGA